MKKICISIIRFLTHIILIPLELCLKSASRKPAPPPIFIIGAPRSGTSLLYELIITHFHMAYISNLAHRFYLTPLAASWIGSARISKWQGDFTSRFGHIDGWGAPNEGGWVWRRWLHDGDWTSGKEFKQSHIKSLRALTSGLSAIFKAPFLNKNVMHSNRLQLMHKIWPDALYIYVRRDSAENARSIVRAERAEAGPLHDNEHWWSVRPSIAPRFAGKDDITRAAAQVIGTGADIERDIQTVGAHKMFTIEYSDMCNKPEAIMANITAFMANHDVMLKEKSSIPNSFPISRSKPLDANEEALLLQTLRHLNTADHIDKQ